jgi:Flp pilus assembly protein TadG
MSFKIIFSYLQRPAVSRLILKLAKNEQGSSVIEFALIAQLLVVVLLSTIETGRALWTLNALHYSVEEAARCASVNATTCGTTGQIQSFAAARSGGSFNANLFTVTVAACGNQVSVNYPMQLNIPFMSGDSLTLTAQSCYPI